MRMTFGLRGAAVTVAAVALMMAGAQQALAADDYSVEKTWKIGGDGGWDYLTVDSGNHILYIARGNRIQIVDTQSGKLLKEITGFQGTHGVALDSAGKYGYISDGRANTVSVFDRSTYAVTATIPAGENPDGILFEPQTQRVFAFNGRSKNITVIDAASNKVLATIPGTGKLEFPQTDGKGTVWVNVEDKSEILKIDAQTMKVTAKWSVLPCEEPSGLAFDAAHRRLFSVCDKVMAVSDGDAGKVVAHVAIGDGPDAAAFDAKSGLAFSSNGEGTLTVVKQNSADSYAVVQTLKTMKGARTMALDPATGLAYTVTAEFGPAPAATAENPHPRPAILPHSFVVLVLGK